MKLAIVGDIHGNTKSAVATSIKAREAGCQIMMQVGDFGFWPHVYSGIDFLDTFNEQLKRDNIKCIWTDGNHENHTQLQWYVKNNPKSSSGHTYIRSNILYSPRGHYWTWDNKKFMTVGGAVSIDKASRLYVEEFGHYGRGTKPTGPETLWWPGEQLTEAETVGIETKMNARREQGKANVDYLFTHDCPTSAPFRHRIKADLESQAHRQRMDRVGKAVRPTLWFHGHMHEKYDGYPFGQYDWDDDREEFVYPTTVYGLECDGMPYNWGVLDTETDSFTFAPTNL